MTLNRSFDYVIDVPEGGRASLPWVARVRTPVDPEAELLVGHSPAVALDDFDVRPGVQRTRITLTAANSTGAAWHEASLTIDRGFANMLKPHDLVHVARGRRDGLGISVLRQGLLIAAAGSVSSVSLGDTVSVRRPGDLVREAEQIFRARDPAYEMWNCPIEVTTETGTRLLHWGRPTLGRYEVFVVHGFVCGRECVAITLPGICPDCAATITAPLLDKPDALQVRPFGDPKEERETRVLFSLEAARIHLEAGELDAAESAVYKALMYERSNEQAQSLLQEIDERRRR